MFDIELHSMRTFGKDSHGTQRMNPTNFGDAISFHRATSRSTCSCTRYNIPTIVCKGIQIVMIGAEFIVTQKVNCYIFCDLLTSHVAPPPDTNLGSSINEIPKKNYINPICSGANISRVSSH